MLQKTAILTLFTRFLYAHLQLATICQEHTLTAVKEALDQLPDSYDEVYLRILTKLEAHTPRNRLLAKRVIAWVLCAVRPLSVAELTEALIVRIPERRLDQEGRCSGEAILEVCMSLIVAETQGGNTVFRFAHFSVKEFFHQHSLAPEPRSKSNFIIDTEKTHDEIAEICVGYLSFDPFLRGPLDYETLYECRDLFEAFIQEHPLLDYAGAAWTEHLRKNLGENETLSASISNLFASTANIGLSFQVYWFRTLADGFPKGATPLHIASFFGLPDPLETLLLLAETGAINATDSLGRTPLHWACLKGHSAVVQRLLEAGVEMKALDKKGFNPMGLAALSGQTKTFKILLQVQRDMIDTEKDQQLGIALLAAAQGKSREIVSLLLDAGADPNVPVHPDMDPLWVAAWEGDLTIVEQLLEAGANVDSGRKYGNALQEAAASGSLEIIEVLLMAGADVNARGGPAGTALNAAAFRGYYECVELLLIAGAEVRFPDDAYGGARTLAEAMEHSNVVKLLLEYAPETSTPNETLPQTTINGILQLAEPAAPLTQPSPSPTNLIQLEAMNAGARSLFQTVETGDVETARRMVGFGANFISSALASGDVAFIERFYQVIIYQVDTIQNLKNTELMGLLFELFEGFYTGVMQSSVDKELLLDGFRTAMGIAMQKLLDGDYAPMMRGLVVHREKKLLGVIENRDEDAAERSLRFAAEWIRIGIRVPGHSLIARGFAKLYVAGLKALEDKGFQALANQILQSSVCGTKQEELVGLYEIGTAARLGGCSVAETRIRQVAAGLLQGDAADGVDEKFRQRLRDILSPPPDISGETSPEWGDDEIPWWDVYRTSS
jgi:ankyrin repeat protein